TVMSSVSNIERSTPSAVTTTARWGARILSALILLFWGFFIVASLVGDEGRSSRALTTRDYVSLTTMVISFAGLGVAWKWEGAGAAITLVAVSIGAGANWKSLLFPVTLVPITAGLFLLSWGLGRMRLK